MRCPQADSNCRPCLRRAVLYPLSYGGPGVRDYVTSPCRAAALGLDAGGGTEFCVVRT